MKHGPYKVRLTPAADEDLLRSVEFLLDRDVDAAVSAQAAITAAFEFLRTFPFSCRKARDVSTGPLLREMVIPFGQAGSVALFEIDDARTVTILAVRHQREDDYH